MPLLKKKRVLAAKIESTPGTAESLSASDAVFNVYDATIQPSIEFDNRDAQGGFSPLYGTLGAYGGTCTFTTEIVGDDDPFPDWVTTFLPACGLVESTGVFLPVDEAPGTNVKTLTIGLYEDGLFKSIRGAAGTWCSVLSPGKESKRSSPSRAFGCRQPTLRSYRRLIQLLSRSVSFRQA
jgi:hypothetical protein